MGIFDFWGPNEETKKLLEQLKARWSALYLWGIKSKAPNAHLFWEEWERFRATIDANNVDLSEVNPAVSNLHTAELYAMEKGFAAPAEVVGIDIENQSAANQTAAAVDQAARAVQNQLPDIPKIPWATIGLVSGGALITIGLVGLWAGKKAAPYALTYATGGAIPMPREYEPPTHRRGDYWDPRDDRDPADKWDPPVGSEWGSWR